MSIYFCIFHEKRKNEQNRTLLTAAAHRRPYSRITEIPQAEAAAEAAQAAAAEQRTEPPPLAMISTISH